MCSVRELRTNWNVTKDLQLNAEHQIQISSLHDHDQEEDWTEANLWVVLLMSLNTSRGKAMASNSSARKVVELQEVTLCECRAPGKMQICVEVACTMLCTMVVLVMAKIKINSRPKLSTAMEVTKKLVE